jgi:hypothetical protein
MPREVARLFLRVTDLKVERLQDMTPFDAWKEGGRIAKTLTWEEHIPEFKQIYRDIWFKSLWNSTIKKKDIEQYGWDANPWVWVIEFEKNEVTP